MEGLIGRGRAKTAAELLRTTKEGSDDYDKDQARKILDSKKGPGSKDSDAMRGLGINLNRTGTTKSKESSKSKRGRAEKPIKFEGRVIDKSKLVDGDHILERVLLGLEKD